MEFEHIKIESDRIVMVPLSMQWAANIFEELTDQITKYMKISSLKSLDAANKFIRNALAHMKKGTEVSLAVLDKNTEEFFGCAGISDLHSKHPEIGIWLKKAAHHKGFGMETVGALVDWARAHLDFEYLRYPVDKRNTCIEIPKVLGGMVKKEYLDRSGQGEQLDIVEYGIH